MKRREEKRREEKRREEKHNPLPEKKLHNRWNSILEPRNGRIGLCL